MLLSSFGMEAFLGAEVDRDLSRYYHSNTQALGRDGLTNHECCSSFIGVVQELQCKCKEIVTRNCVLHLIVIVG
jgi:hypothetical protein